MKDAHKNFIEIGADTLPYLNVFYETIITALNNRMKNAAELIKDGRFVEALKELEND